MRSRRLKRGIRLFDHPVLDWGSRVHPVLPALFWSPLIVATFVVGASSMSPGATAGCFLAGYAAWIVSEYAIHRWFFHFRPQNTTLRRLFYYVHEHHHRYQEFDRLLAPPLLSLSIGGILACLFIFVLQPLIGDRAALVVMSGLGTGYLVYDYTHLYIHFAKPRTRWGRYLRRCHLDHHFRQPDRWFCISWPLVDYLFRTQGRRRTSPGIPQAADPTNITNQLLPETGDPEFLPRKVREYERQTTKGDRRISPSVE